MLTSIRTAHILLFMALPTLPTLPTLAAAQAHQPHPADASKEDASPHQPLSPSAFDSYQPHTEVPTADWRQANKTVAQRGGWRAYAREASAAAQPHANDAKPAPTTAAHTHQ